MTIEGADTLDRHGHHQTQRGARAALLDRVAAGRRADLLPSRGSVRRGAGGHYLCRRHHGAVSVRGHDVEPGAFDGGTGTALAAAWYVDRPVGFGDHPARGAGLSVRFRDGTTHPGHRPSRSETGEPGAVGALSDRSEEHTSELQS